MSTKVRVLQGKPLPTPVFQECQVLSNVPDGDIYRRLVLQAPEIARRAEPGQFLMLSIPESLNSGVVLPRPMAVHRRRSDTVEVVFAVQGKGTRALAQLGAGAQLGVTGPLGKGFQVPPRASAPVLVIGRGIGICSVMGVVEQTAHQKRPVSVVLSGRHPGAIVGVSDMDELGVEDLFIVTDEAGTSDPLLLRQELQSRFVSTPPCQIVVCGSRRLEVMAATLGQEWGIPVQVALEAHMACGIGYCHGCAVPADDSPGEAPLICRDGPVFEVQQHSALNQ